MLSILFWSLWRRLYGEGTFKKYVSRAVQSILAILMLGYQLSTPFDWASWGIALLIGAWVMIEYWSRSVGEIIDAGLNHRQNKESYGRWFRAPLDWVYDLLGKKKYVGFYDFWYSLARYAIGALPLLYYSWLAILLMPFQYFIYLGCNKLYMRFPRLFGLPLTLNEPKNLAEIIHGALFGGVICAMSL